MAVACEGTVAALTALVTCAVRGARPPWKVAHGDETAALSR